MRISRNNRGAVLLEVVLALLLFVATVAVVSGALNASMNSIERQRFGVHAANLAATVHAELDLGLRSTENVGPEPFTEPFEGWTWQLVPGAVEDPVSGEANGLTRVEVVIRNTNSTAVYRLAQTHQIVKASAASSASTPAAEVGP